MRSWALKRVPTPWWRVCPPPLLGYLSDKRSLIACLLLIMLALVMTRRMSQQQEAWIIWFLFDSIARYLGNDDKFAGCRTEFANRYWDWLRLQSLSMIKKRTTEFFSEVSVWEDGWIAWIHVTEMKLQTSRTIGSIIYFCGCSLELIWGDTNRGGVHPNHVSVMKDSQKIIESPIGRVPTLGLSDYTCKYRSYYLARLLMIISKNEHCEVKQECVWRNCKRWLHSICRKLVCG